MCDMDTGEYCDVWVQTIVTALKPHKCVSCSTITGPGKKYVKHFSKFDGYVNSEKLCLACEAAQREFGDFKGHVTPYPDQLEKAITECLDESGLGPPTIDDKRWRQLLAGIKRRQRQAAMEIRIP